MQIRVANRQDEPIIRTIISQANVEVGDAEIDLPGRDSDLTNIDSEYFWHDGIFLVAEEDNSIVGLAGARRGETDDVLSLKRIVVVPARRRTGCACLLMDTIVFFAGNAEYKVIEYTPRKTDPVEPFLGFTADGGVWRFDVCSSSPKACNI
jgi:N-acetylglutamate synthase-like GNAT family acetyltransferase